MVQKYDLPRDESGNKAVEVTEQMPTNEAEEKAVETEAPTEAPQEDKNLAVEAVKPEKKKGGRKSINVPIIEQKLDFVKRDKVIREHEVADFSVRTTKGGALELATRHFMLNYDITEDYASKILVYIHANAQKVKEHNIYFDGMQAIAEALELSYPTVQKTVKKLRDKKIISKASIGQNSYELSTEANRFFKSISNNIQIVLTFEVAEEEQLEAINKDGSLNEDMVK